MSDSSAPDLSIAIVGMACRFPGAADLEQFWENLRSGVESIRPITADELAAAGVSPELLEDPDYVRASAVLDDIDLFDAAFFDFNPREAEIADPQQRIFLECCWQALERAGCDPDTFPGAIGVFGGTGMSTYLLNNVLSNPELVRTVAPFQIMIGADKDYLAPRTSYKLNLKGPSISVQTACSTSLVAVHLACQSLQDYQSDLVLAGGVSVRVPQQVGYRYQEGGIASPDGHCRAFDRKAQGTVFGSGAGVVVLKRLAEAVADGDPILAVIRGSAVNNDGAAKVGFTAPSVEGQVAVISEALAAAEVDGETIGYVEAHGTGTTLGDPIEIAALSKAFAVDRDAGERCAIGSVKTNIGHLDSASGIAGLIKTVLALSHRQIPPSLHFEEPNPEIDFAASPFYVNTRLAEWKANGTPRRAGVSSFGIGGTNAHAVLEEAPSRVPSGASRADQLLLLSARTPSALESVTDNLVRHLEEHPEQALADVAYTTQVGRKVFGHRRALVCRDRADAVAALRARDPHRVLTLIQEGRDRPAAFLFPGQGTQHVGMGRELYDAEPAFRRALDLCAHLLVPHLGFDLRTVLYPPPEAAEESALRLAQTDLAQPALFAVEYALALLWQEWGVRPAAMLGHSIGEYVAACLSGVFTLGDALALVAARGRLMQGLPAGAMLAVPRPEEEVRELLGAALSLAAVNGPGFSVVSGPAEAVEALARKLGEEGVDCRRLHTSHAFHSAMMDPILPAFAAEARKVRLAPPRIPFLSNLTGTWIDAAQATDPDYWVRHLRETVRFAAGAGELLGDRSRVLVEVGPGRTLGTLVWQHPAAGAERVVVASLRRPQDGGGDADLLAGAVARLWLAGVRIGWPGYHTGELRHRVELPTYPFERRRFWLEPGKHSLLKRFEGGAPAAAEPATGGGIASAPVAAGRHARPALATAYAPPADEVERALAAIWERALGIAGVGAYDDFYELGGHSLLATQITSEVRATFAADLALKTLFEAPSVSGMAAALRRQREQGTAALMEPAALPVLVPDPAHRHEPFPLTDVQQAYWIGRSGAFELGEVATHTYMEVDTRGVDLERTAHAWRRLIDRHDMLRAIVLADGQQQILERVPPYEIAILDLRRSSPAERAEGLSAVRRRMSHQVLPSDRWPIFEVAASLVEDDRVRLHISFDYLIGDAWSWHILTRDLARFYQNPEAELPPLELSFRDYVLATIAFEQEKPFARALAYWQGRLADLPPAPDLPLAMSPAALGRPRFVRHAGRLPRTAWRLLKERGARAGLTPSAVLLAAFAEILTAWSKSPRFTLNLTLFNRLPLHRQVNEVVGDFTSLTLLAIDNSAPAPFAVRARRIQERLWEDLDHRYVSGVRVLREMARSQGGLARGFMPVVFTSTLNLAPHPQPGEEPAAEAADVDADAEERPFQISQTPQVWIDHQVVEVKGAIHFNWDVVEDLFPAGLIDAMFGAYRGLLERLAAEEESWSQSHFNLVPAGELAEQAAANAVAAPVPAGLLHTLVAPPSERPALVAPGRTLSYRELHRRALALAHELRALGARPNTLIAVVMEKGWEQAVATLGILWSGAAYLPVDPDLPAERRRYLLENGEVAIAVTQPWLDERLVAEGWPEQVRRLQVEEAEPEGPDPAPIVPAQGPEDLAYVIFTSGSTGRPKGVMIDHRGAVNTIADINQRFGVGPEDRVLALSSLSFDLSVYDLFGTLAAGGAVVYPQASQTRDPEHWAERLESGGVSVWNTVPALMEILVDYLADQGRPLPASLRLVMLSGDWIPVSLPGRIRGLSPHPPELVSLGGATEASIWSILHPIGTVGEAARSIPYGKPMVNQTFHVLDPVFAPRPTWVPGDLYIGGIGLAKGYWRDPEKTAASFLLHPRTAERLYRTGDLGRYLPGGDIEFLGREDSQVKIRGYRVELGEIELALTRHPAVREAVVLAREGGGPGEKRLVAYLVAEEGTLPAARPDPAELRSRLRHFLPDYMIPTSFVFLDALPLTANGKVDRRALPAPDAEPGAKRGEYVAPRTEVEAALATICGEALGIEKLGIDDDFFELGGDSLMAIRAVFRIRKAMGVELQVRSFFDAPTVAELAELVEDLILAQIEELSDEEAKEQL
jgi:amino acid adenylation domain-containing protein